jgi:hypothetical protein
MIAEKKKQLQTLLALVVVLVAVGAYTYWTTRTASTGVKASPAAIAARAAALPSAGNAQIRLDLIGDKTDKNAVGRRNVFQYYVPPPPPTKPAPPPPPYVPPAVVNSGPPRPVTPPAPPSALSTFKYDAILIPAKPGKQMASVSEGTANRYNVTEGEYILGRYRINWIKENSMEIEDVDQNRRQTYTRQTQ